VCCFLCSGVWLWSCHRVTATSTARSDACCSSCTWIICAIDARRSFAVPLSIYLTKLSWCLSETTTVASLLCTCQSSGIRSLVVQSVLDIIYAYVSQLLLFFFLYQKYCCSMLTDSLFSSYWYCCYC